MLVGKKPEQVKAILVPHLQIEHDDRRLELPKGPAELAGVVGMGDVIAERFGDTAYGRDGLRSAIDDEETVLAHAGLFAVSAALGSVDIHVAVLAGRL